MSSFKRFLGGLAVALLPVALFAFGAYMGAFQFLRSPEPVKQALSESGMYDVVVREALAKAQVSAGGQALVPTDNPEVQKIIGQSIPPSMVEQQAEGAVDNIFAWLQGKNNQLQFAINVDQAKGQLADGLASYTQQYLDALPPCTGGELPDPNQPLQATCKPAGFDSAAAAAKVKNDILANEQFLPNDELSASALENNTGQPLEQKWSAVPAVYEQVRWGTYIASAVALLAGIGVLTCSKDLRAGLKRFGLISLIVGGVSALLAWLVGAVLQRLGENALAETGAAALQGSIVTAVSLVTQDIRDWWLGYGLVLVGAGVVALVVRMVVGRRQTQQPNPVAAVGEAPAPVLGAMSTGESTAPVGTSGSVESSAQKIRQAKIQ